MQAVLELTKVQQRLRGKIDALESELTAIDQAIRVLQRESPAEVSKVNGSAGKQFKQMGLSEACLAIVGSELIKPVTVRDRLMAGGYRVKNKAKLLSSVFPTLARLASLGKLEAGTVGGKRAFRRKVEVQRSGAGDRDVHEAFDKGHLRQM